MKNNLRYLVVTAIMALTAVVMTTHDERVTPLPRPLAAFPTHVGDWRMIRDSQFDQATLDVLKPTEYLAKRYQRGDAAVIDLYVGYHDGAAKAGPLHSPKNCLPGSGWYEASSREVTIPLGDGDLRAVEAVYRKGEHAELFLYWFEVAGEAVTNEYALKLREVLHAMRQGRRDACFIRISTPMASSREQAAERITSFLRDARPMLRQHLPT